MQTLFFLLALFTLPVQADQIQLVSRGDEGLATFLGLASRAQRSIDITTFIYEPCEASGQLFTEILARKAKEGVKVRVLLDSLTQPKKQSQNLADYFARYGIELRTYNDYSILSPMANLRLHAKLMIIDGTTYVSGGRNIADDYFSLADNTENFLDKDLIVSGASVREARDSFSELWNASLSGPKTGVPENFQAWNSFCKKNLAAEKKKIRGFLAENGEALMAGLPVQSCERVSFIADHPEFGNPRYNENRIRNSASPPNI